MIVPENGPLPTREEFKVWQDGLLGRGPGRPQPEGGSGDVFVGYVVVTPCPHGHSHRWVCPACIEEDRDDALADASDREQDR